MGGSVSSFRHSTATRKPPKAAEPGPLSINLNPFSSILNLITRPACCLKTYKAKRRTLSPTDKKSSKVMCRRLTLEDWLLSSPDSNTSRTEAELNVFRQFCHKKVHPSSTKPQLASVSKARESFSSLKKLSKAEHASQGSDMGVSSMRRKQSHKLKKVSFRLPEESDIIIIYSPEPEETFGDQESS